MTSETRTSDRKVRKTRDDPEFYLISRLVVVLVMAVENMEQSWGELEWVHLCNLLHWGAHRSFMHLFINMLRNSCYIPGRIRYTFCLQGTHSLGVVIWIKVFRERCWDCETDSVDLGDWCWSHEKLMNSHQEKRSQRKQSRENQGRTVSRRQMLIDRNSHKEAKWIRMNTHLLYFVLSRNIWGKGKARG